MSGCGKSAGSLYAGGSAGSYSGQGSGLRQKKIRRPNFTTRRSAGHLAARLRSSGWGGLAAARPLAIDTGQKIDHRGS